MPSEPRVSVVIRAKNEAESIGKTLALLGSQTIAAETEVVVVDSGSRDRTVAIARDGGARIVEMPASAFTYGRSLNLGCAETRAPLIIALSAHAFPLDDSWLERMAATFDDARVACACGYPGGPEGELLTGPRVQDMADALRYPFWGYSNASGGFRAHLWRERAFREDMPGTEDKEWAWHWLERGWVTVVDPALAVDHDHFGEDPVRLYRRAHREAYGHAMFQDLEPYTFAELAREWWTDQGGRKNMLRARLSPRRGAQLLGWWAGRRAGRPG